MGSASGSRDVGKNGCGQSSFPNVYPTQTATKREYFPMFSAFHKSSGKAAEKVKSNATDKRCQKILFFFLTSEDVQRLTDSKR